jgi:tetratricopeptide (TPR) repeat protein
MEGLHERYPSDRENSLYASVELSLRRLPAEGRERAKAVAVFHGGAHLYVLGQVLGAEAEEAAELARQLIGVGLAEYMGDNHLRLDPALGAYLLRGMDEEEREALEGRWAEAMARLMGFLYQQRGQDARLAARLTLLELPNLLAMLRRAEEKSQPEAVVDLAGSVEYLLTGLGRPQALAEAETVRERAAENLVGWGHIQFTAANAEIDRLLERGEVRAAHAAAERLLQRCKEEGEGAYPMANADLGMAHLTLGSVLLKIGAAAEALPLLGEARRLFEMLARDDNTWAARLDSVALTESGDCLKYLGRLDEAAAAYEEAVRRDEEGGQQRDVAVGKAQLGTIRLLQGRYTEALATYEDARQTFESLGELLSVAGAWHQMGMVHRHAGQYEQAERAYRQSLAIRVQQRDALGEADTLNELGNLYYFMGRLEEAVRCYRQAADVYVRLQAQREEGAVRNNLAGTLLRLGHYDEARAVLLRAIDCNEPYGHVAEPWKTWDILSHLEVATGDAVAAARARQKAFDSYLTYRREGGYGTTPAARLCAAAAGAIVAGDTSEIEEFLSQPLGEETPPWARVAFPKLLAVVRGERDPALADDPALDYDDAVELRLLLETLGAG